MSKSKLRFNLLVEILKVQARTEATRHRRLDQFQSLSRDSEGSSLAAWRQWERYKTVSIS